MNLIFNMKKYIVLLKEEFHDNWTFQLQTDILQEAIDNKEEMIQCNGIYDCIIVRVEEIK